MPWVCGDHPIIVFNPRGSEGRKEIPREPSAEAGPSSLSLLLAPGSAPLVPNMVAHPFRLGQQGDNEHVKKMAGTGAKGAPSSSHQDKEASGPWGQPL